MSSLEILLLILFFKEHQIKYTENHNSLFGLERHFMLRFLHTFKSYLNHFHIWQTVQKGLQVNSIKNNAVVKYVSIWFEINNGLFLQCKRKILQINPKDGRKCSVFKTNKPWGVGTCSHDLQWRMYGACRPVSLNTAQLLQWEMSLCQK